MRHGGAGEESIHVTQLSVTASLMAQGVDIDEAVEMVLEATRLVGEDGWDWIEEEQNIREMCEDFLKKAPARRVN